MSKYVKMYGRGNPAKGWYRFWEAFLESKYQYGYPVSKNSLTGETTKAEAMRSTSTRYEIGTGVFISYGLHDGDKRIIVLSTRGGRQLLAVRPNGDFLVSISTAYDRNKISSTSFLKATWYGRRYAFVVDPSPRWWEGLNLHDPGNPVPYVDESIVAGWRFTLNASTSADWWQCRKSAISATGWEVAPVKRKGFSHEHLDKRYHHHVGGKRFLATPWKGFVARRDARYERILRKQRNEGAVKPRRKQAEIDTEHVKTLAAMLELDAPAKSNGRLDLVQFRKNTEGVKV